jgi:NAD(P)-dependent dehydrogenase (short-subunit alcohol dehydrogenase family)
VSQQPGRVALISGGSRGIGAATVRLGIRRPGDRHRRQPDRRRRGQLSAAQVADLVASLLSADTPGITGRILEVATAISF